jgi:hypothetical protein
MPPSFILHMRSKSILSSNKLLNSKFESLLKLIKIYLLNTTSQDATLSHSFHHFGNSLTSLVVQLPCLTRRSLQALLRSFRLSPSSLPPTRSKHLLPPRHTNNQLTPALPSSPLAQFNHVWWNLFSNLPFLTLNTYGSPGICYNLPVTFSTNTGSIQVTGNPPACWVYRKKNSEGPLRRFRMMGRGSRFRRGRARVLFVNLRWAVSERGVI